MNTEKIFTQRNTVILIMITLAVLCRLVPAPDYRMWNFTPIGAIALFGGAFITNRRYAFLLPFSALLFSDILLQIYNGTGFYSSMPWVYGSFFLITLLGRYIKKLQKGYSSVVLLMVAPCLSSMLFFIISNLGVWTLGSYGYTATGLIECYVAAIPFYSGTILGDMFFTAVLFGSFSIIKNRYPAVAIG